MKNRRDQVWERLVVSGGAKRRPRSMSADATPPAILRGSLADARSLLRACEAMPAHNVTPSSWGASA